jgi:hypothetical protein
MSIVLNLRSLLLTCTVLLFTVCVGGAQEVKRPTADSDDSTVGCSGTFMATPANSLGAMYDIAGTSTSASLTAFGVNGALGSQKKAHVLTNWQPPTTVYSSLVLKVSSSCWVYGLGGTCGVYYSTTGGAPWTVIRSSGAAWSSVTDTIALSPGQSLSTLRVGICASGKNTKTDADPGAGSVTVSDVWTEGSTPPPSAPSSLIGAAAPTATSVSLGWSDTSNNELGFKIERCQAAGVDVSINTDNAGIHNVRLPWEYENLLTQDIINFDQLRACQDAAFRHAFAWPYAQPPRAMLPAGS